MLRRLAPIPVLILVAAGCARRPSAELELDGPDANAEPSGRANAEPDEQLDARVEAVCQHSFNVLSNESPSMRSPGIESEFIARCIAGNQVKHAELGEQRWAERAGCIEQARTPDELGACDGRVPRSEPNPPVVSIGLDVRAVCQRVFDILLAENPDLVNMLGPLELDTMLNRCVTDAELERAEDPIKFDRQAQCIMTANTVADFEQCDD